MPQFLIDASKISNGCAEISGNDARHITQVLRLATGAALIVTNGSGKKWRAVITSATPKRILLTLKEEIASVKNDSKLTLAQAVIKHDRLEWIVQKAVELGVSDFIPYTSVRTIPHFGDQTATKKLSRWQKIALEAAKQCGTAELPRVSQIVTFKELTKHFKDYSNVILFYEGESSNDVSSLTPKKGSTLIVIGPEGGFSPEDIDLARDLGTITCGLGPLILRVETAAVAAIALIQEKLGYFHRTPL